MRKKYQLLLLFALLLNATSPLAYANAPLKEASGAELSSQAPTKDSSTEGSTSGKVLSTSIINDAANISDQMTPESDTGDHLTEGKYTSEQEIGEGQKNKAEDSGSSSTEPRIFSPYAGVSDLPGASQPSMNGSYLLFPLRVGIVSQPQEEQYIVQGTNASLSIQTTSWVNSFGSVSADVNGWQQQGDGTWKGLGKIGTFNSPTAGLLGSTLQSINIPVANLKTGSYYFQVKSNLNTLPLLGAPVTNYSRLALVTVKDKAVPALSITATTPKVIFEKVNYSAKAVTNPVDSTSKITWSSPLAGLTFLKTEGRSIDFNIASQGDAINKDVQAPGIPLSITATATNPDNTSVKSDRVIYSGGLQAKNVTEDSGFSWKLDDQGLVDLNNSVSGATSWNYEWKYFDGTTAKSFTSTDGANKYKGTVTSLASLNDPANLLTFDKNSKFMTLARQASDKGTPFTVQVFFSTTIDTGNGKTETINISSNKAQLLVTKIIGTLVLDQVPSFNFQQIPATFVYEGTQGREPSAKGNLQITDTRQQAGWQLVASMTRLKKNNNQTLEANSQVKLSGLPVETPLTDDGSSKNIVNSSKSESYLLTGSLLLQPDPSIILAKGDKFSSTITWTLVSTTGTIPPA